MKKLMLILSMLAVLAISSTALAAPTKDAELFSTEQTRATQWLDTMLTQKKPAAALNVMSAQAKKDITAAKMTELQQKIEKELGTLQSARFVGWTRFDQADQVIYLLSFSKEQVVQCVFLFSPTGELNTFALTPMKQNAQDAQDAKDKKAEK